MDLLAFSLDAENYAVPVAAVSQIHRAVAVSALPGGPRVTEGAINVRGSIVPVIDLRRRFGIAAKPPALTDLLIVIRAGSRAIAIRSTGNARIIAVPDEQIDAPREVYPHPRFVSGIAKLPDGLLVIHDPVSFLTEAESAKLDDALASAEAKSPGHGA